MTEEQASKEDIQEHLAQLTENLLEVLEDACCVKTFAEALLHAGVTYAMVYAPSHMHGFITIQNAITNAIIMNLEEQEGGCYDD